MKKFQVGDIVKLNKKKLVYYGIPIWYSTDIYKILEIDKEYNTATLNKDLPNAGGNKINTAYLKSLKKDRKKKLLKLKFL